MHFFIFLFLLSACQKPQVVNKRASERPQNAEPETPPAEEPQDKRFQLNWQKSSGDVKQYEVRFGLANASLAEKVLVIETGANFDAEKPSAIVTIPGARLAGRNEACFQVVALNAQGSSEPSSPQCVPLQ